MFVDRIRIPPVLFLKLIDVELPYYLYYRKNRNDVEKADYVEIVCDGTVVRAEAVAGENRVFLGEVDRRKLERVEELRQKDLIKPVRYMGEPEGKALCPVCGEPVFESWAYYVGLYYHSDCFKKAYRKFW
ncbi:hypothetical protein [Geoglobus acetivorans]